MPHCCAFGCSNESKKQTEKAGRGESKVTFHRVPGKNQKKLRKKWLIAIGRRNENLPKCAYLCSDHFDPSCFDEGVDMRNRLLGGTKRKLKDNIVPTIFAHKSVQKERASSVARAAKRQRQEVLDELLFNPKRRKINLKLKDGTSCEESTSTETTSSDAIFSDTISFETAPSDVSCKTASCDLECSFPIIDLSSTVETTNLELETYKIYTQSGGVTVVDKGMQFPLDVAQEICHEHSYSSSKVKEQGSNDRPLQTSPFQEATVEDVPLQLNSSPPSSPVIESVSVTHDPDYECSSQSSQTSTAPSQNEYTSGTKRLLLVYEDNLRELLKFCPKCGSPVISEEVKERESEGSQFSVKINCLNGCNFTWHAQPCVPGVKGEGNVALTAGLFFSGIQFSKFQQFSSIINLKTIGKDCYYNLREKYVFPVIDACWDIEQNNITKTLKDRGEAVILAGDGRCDSPGHSAKYGTYTMLDVQSDKVVDFKVVSVCEVKNSNAMEKKGFIETLKNIEKAGVNVAGVSTDSHPQIKKYMREEQKNKKHHIDPWHACKNVQKKLSASSKKKGCEKLSEWVPSITNHFWWSIETCQGDAEILKEKWLSITNHIVNRHDFPANKVFKKCLHDGLTEGERRKKWLTPGSPPHNELLKIVHDTRLLKTLPHLTDCIRTTALESYHSLYLKHLPKHTHYSHKVMEEATKLIALDQNHNASRQQAKIQSGDREGELRYKIAWSKVSKRHDAEPVLEPKDYSYLQEMLKDVTDKAEHNKVHQNLVVENKQRDTRHILAPIQRPPRQDIINKRISF